MTAQHIAGTKGLLLNTDFGVALFFDGSNKYQLSLPNTSSYKANTGGLCGYYDGIKTNDFRLPNGTAITNYNIFGDMWTEPDDEDPAYALIARPSAKSAVDK